MNRRDEKKNRSQNRRRERAAAQAKTEAISGAALGMLAQAVSLLEPAARERLAAEWRGGRYGTGVVAIANMVLAKVPPKPEPLVTLVGGR